MSVHTYLVTINNKKRVFVAFDLGSSIGDFGEEDIDLINDSMERIEELELYSVMDKEITALTLNDVEKILEAVKHLLSIAYDTDITTHGSLEKTLRIWGLVEMVKGNSEFDVKVVGESEFDELEDEYSEKGYTIVIF